MAAKKTEETVTEKKAEKVKIRLFKDSGRYRDDVTVIVNGKVFKIQRGVEVEVPKNVAKVIERSIAQKEYVAELDDQLRAEYESQAKSFGLNA